MKNTLVSILLFALLTLLVPAAAFLKVPTAAAAPQSEGSTSPEASAAPTATPAPKQDPLGAGDDLLIWDSGSQQLLTVPMRDYLIGAVASEMPINWPDEALKAQAVAAHSYALYQKQHAGPDAAMTGWFSADPARRQGFMTDEVLRSYWGVAYEENYQHLSALVDTVLDQVLLYEDGPAAACYHAISCGVTEASQNVWEESLPYLQGVDSPLDLASPDYEKSVTYTDQQMYDALSLSGLGIQLDGLDPQEWFGACDTTAAGYIKTIQTADQTLTGTQLRQILGLRSACFSITHEEDVFTVTTKGYGHGVGLSQYGANAMALAGKSCEEILAYYYPGTRLERL